MRKLITILLLCTFTGIGWGMNSSLDLRPRSNTFTETNTFQSITCTAITATGRIGIGCPADANYIAKISTATDGSVTNFGLKNNGHALIKNTLYIGDQLTDNATIGNPGLILNSGTTGIQFRNSILSAAGARFSMVLDGGNNMNWQTENTGTYFHLKRYNGTTYDTMVDISTSSTLGLGCEASHNYKVKVSTATDGSVVNAAVDLKGGFRITQLTEAELKSFSPQSEGVQYYDITNKAIIVSTGTAAGAFGLIYNGSTAPTGW